jgi:hypothetical protein
MDWNKQTRDAVEAAAAAGDEGAQAALRMHQHLDRLDAKVADLRTYMRTSFDRLDQQLDKLKSDVTIAKSSRKRRLWFW